MDSYDWIADALIVFVNSEEFQESTNTFLKTQSNNYFIANATQQTKQKVFNSYQLHFQKLLEDFFKAIGVSKEQLEPAFELILTSEEGLNDTRLSSDFLASHDFTVFDLLMTYYYAQGLLIEASDAGDADDMYVQELLSNAELAEINLAIAISNAIEQKIEEGKKKKIPKNPISKPSTAISQPSPAASSGDMFKLTGNSAGSSSTSSSSAPKQFTPLSADTLQAKKEKLVQLEGELTQKLASIRDEQESRTRSMAPELAQKMNEKRRRAMALQVAKGQAKKGAAKKK